MILTFEQRHAPGMRLCPAFGGSSSTAATTNNTDMRVVGGDGSSNVSAQNSGSGDMKIISTDHGAVSGGLQLATHALDANTAVSTASMNTTTDVFKGALGAVTDANQRLALAYQSGQAGDQTSLKYAGFVVVGLAAVMLFKNKG